MLATSSYSRKAHILFLIIIKLSWAQDYYGHHDHHDHHHYDDYNSDDRYPMNKGVHVIDKGERKDGDTKLYSETLRQKGDSYGEDEYCYPKRGSTDQIKITEFEVKDEDEANDGGLAFEVSGGEGQGQVCFALKSRPGKSYHYKVDVYGYRIVNGVIVNENMATGSFGTAGGLGSGYGYTGAGYGTVGSGVGNTGGYGGLGRFGASGLNSNSNLMGNSYGNSAGYGSGFQQNGIGTAGYGQNPPYGSGNYNSRGPYKK